MKYRAVVRLGSNVISQCFPTVGEAEQWIASENNNLEYVSYVQELNENNEVIDWFYYSR